MGFILLETGCKQMGWKEMGGTEMGGKTTGAKEMGAKASGVKAPATTPAMAATTKPAAITTRPAKIPVSTSHIDTKSSTVPITTHNTVSINAGSTARLIVTSSSTTPSSVQVSSTSNGHQSKPSATADSNSNRTNIGLIVGLTTAACVAVIAAVLVVLVCRKRTRARRHPEINNDSAQPAPRPYEVISDTKPGQSDDTYTYCPINGMIALPPGVTKPMDAANMKSQPNVSLDDLYSKPNKQIKFEKDSQNASDYACVYEHVKGELMDDGTTGSGNEELNYVEIDHSGVEGAMGNGGSHPESEGITYAEIQPKTTSSDTTPLDGDTPGDMDMSMVENDLYST
ncbi:hypothetical protein LSAT2_011032 [Lamellibrachia satsuma]|nr:hypothetical protein LSAT2_011032 [Lamellibrachia satsuma]